MMSKDGNCSRSAKGRVVDIKVADVLGWQESDGRMSEWLVKVADVRYHLFQSLWLEVIG